MNRNVKSLIFAAAVAAISLSAHAQPPSQLGAGWSGTKQIPLRVDSAGNLNIVGSGASGAVFGPTATGIAPSQPPVYGAGVDGGGLTRGFLTDTSGRQVIVGAGANGAATVGNPVWIAAYDGANTRAVSVASGAGDGIPGNTNLMNANLTFNGSFYDRVRSLSGVGTTGVGLQAAGLASVFNTTLPTYTAGQYGALQMGARGGLHVDLYSPDLGQTPFLATNADGVAVSSSLQYLGATAFGSVFNGTTWDRVRTANSAATTTGTGLVGAGTLIFDGTNWQKQGNANTVAATTGANLAGAGQLGFDGTNWQKITVDGQAAEYINSTGKAASYSAVFSSAVSASGVVFQLQGSVSKTIKIRKIILQGQATSASAQTITINRASTASTGGTPVGLTIYPFDTTNAASGATATGYSAGATVGTLTGVFNQQNINLGAAVPTLPYINWVPADNEQPIILRGTSQFLQIAANTAPPGYAVNVVIEWTEE